MHGKIKSYLTDNWILKLVSLFIALILWFTLIPEEKTFQEKTLSVRLEIHNIPSHLELVERPPQYINVTVRAPNRLIPQISSANVYGILDLQRASVAQSLYSLNRNMVNIPEGAEVKDISPSQVNLKFERTKQVMLEVEANLIGTLPEGYLLTKVEVLPLQVAVKGPESKVQENIKVQTSPIDISTLTQSTEVEAELILPDSALQLASFETVVRVKLFIQEEKEKK